MGRWPQLWGTLNIRRAGPCLPWAVHPKGSRAGCGNWWAELCTLHPQPPCSLCFTHRSAPSCTPLSPCLPQPAVPRSPSKSLKQEHCWAGSSFPSAFCRSPSLRHVWPLHALDRPPPPMPGTLSWPDPRGAGRVTQGGQGSCQDTGWEAVQAGLGAPAGPGLSIPSFILLSPFPELPFLAGQQALGRGIDRTQAPAILGKGEAIRKASWRRQCQS